MKIGIYDSGIGGYTIVKSILKILPEIEIEYYKDSKLFPLGQKSIEEIQNGVINGIQNLIKKNCPIIILACNTACVTSIRYLQNHWLPKNSPETKVLSITKPFTELLEENYTFLKKTNGLLIATSATIKSGFYQTEMKNLGYNLDFLEAPGLADLIEQNLDNLQISSLNILNFQPKLLNPKDFQKKLEILFQDFKLNSNLDFLKYKYILLACTHYPWIAENLRIIFSKSNYFLDPAENVGLKLKNYLLQHKFLKN